VVAHQSDVAANIAADGLIPERLGTRLGERRLDVSL
jgi:hypothetical protein